MRLLVINPNISTGVSDLISAEARRSASLGTEVVTRTASYGMEYIETRLEAVFAAHAAAEVIAAQEEPIDGIVVAAFGDPGMPALKELRAVPVVGITEAAISAAALLGQRFSIIAISGRIRPWYLDAVDRSGVGDRLASLRSLTGNLGEIADVQHDFRSSLLDLSLQAVRHDGADVIILAGAPLAGLGRTLRDAIPVPVVDGISAGVRMCEALVGMQVGTHREGAFAPPPPKPRRNLGAALDRLLDVRQQTTDTISAAEDQETAP